MRIYIAGPYTSAMMPTQLKSREPFRYKLAKKWVPDDLFILESFHYIGKNPAYMDVIKKDNKRIFLDSGAFSMHTKNIKVDLEDYANFIAEHHKYIEVASNLDVIGANKEKKTRKNQKILERLLKDRKIKTPLCPVHHARDKDEWLRKYLAEGYDYIFLGGMVPESTKYLVSWLDRIWGNILTDKDGLPKVKVHGFGLTTPDLMLRYPWYSVDSTSWIMAAATGSIYVPSRTSDRLKAISISALSPSAKKRGSHYNSLSDIEREQINSWIKKVGYKQKNFQGRQYGRGTWNLIMFKWLQDNYTGPSTFKQHKQVKGLFDDQNF